MPELAPVTTQTCGSGEPSEVRGRHERQRRTAGAGPTRERRSCGVGVRRDRRAGTGRACRRHRHRRCRVGSDIRLRGLDAVPAGRHSPRRLRMHPARPVDDRRFTVAGRPGVPDGAVAVSVTVTAPVTASPGIRHALPGRHDAAAGVGAQHAARPRRSPTRRSSSSAASGTIELYENVPGDLMVDVTGAFVAADQLACGALRPGRHAAAGRHP